MAEKTILKIRKGVYGFPYAICNEQGYWHGNANSLGEIRKEYELEIKLGYIELVRELDLYPEDIKPDYKVYGYARVSTKGQAKDGNSLEAQEEALKAAGAKYVCKEAFTGSVTNRPVFENLLKQLKGGDTLIVTKLDRIARSVAGGEEVISQLLKKHVKIHILNMGIIDNSPSGKLMYQMFLAFAEFERSMIVQRTQEGKAIARQKEGYREGRPRTEQARLDHAMELLKDNSYNQVSKITGISVSTLTREKRRRISNT